MRIVVLFVAVLLVAVGVAGIIAPDSLTELRRTYMVTPRGLYAIGTVRMAIGLLVIRSASSSRTPKTLRAIGVLVCLQGLIQGVGGQFVGLDRTRAILEWEAVHTGLLRIGADGPRHWRFCRVHRDTSPWPIRFRPRVVR